MYESGYTAAQPQTYRLTTIVQLMNLLFSAFYLVLGAFSLRLGFAHTQEGLQFFLILLFLLPALYMAAYALRTRLILDGDRIDYRSALRSYSATHDQIEGYRSIRTRYGNLTRCYLKDNRGSFSIPSNITKQTGVQEWFRALTNLDERDADHIKSEISQQQIAASGQADPSVALDNAKTLMIFLSVLGVAAAILAFLQTQPLFLPSVIVLWLLPVVAIFLLYRSPLLYAVFKQKADPRAELSYPIIVSAFGLLFAFAAGDSAHIADFHKLLVLTAIVFFCMVAALVRPALNSTSRTGAFLALLVFAGLYSVGVVHTADTVPDHSIAEPYQAQVVRMYETHGRSTSYHLSLAPWGPMTNGNNVEVSYGTYHSVQVGDSVCIGLHPGYLHAPWYTLTPCSQ
ncbi:MAG: hypothetical protein ACLGPM_09775 [Acidobacteriota bacterium]